MPNVRPPLGFEQVPHLVHVRSGLRAWLTTPAGVVTQVTTQVHGDESMARFLSVTVDDAVLRLPREPEQKLLFVHDWTRLEGYAPETREMLTKWAIRIRKHIERVVVALPRGSPLVRMGISVASVVLTRVGVRFDLVDSIDEVIRELGIRPRRTRAMTPP